MSSPTTTSNQHVYTLRELTDLMLIEERQIMQGGGKSAIARQHEKKRLTARERIALLVDPATKESGATNFQELGLWCAWNMYKEHGGAPAAGVVTGIGTVQGRKCMIIANDATVKAGAFFPMTCKKIIRAQQIAMMAHMPLIYLVDSAGVFLPLQEDVFPDMDDFGRIFRHNAVISAMGIPQIAAIMGFCVAGGGYLPVLCDTLIMTEGSGLYLAGPALVKAAIGQEVTDEELGGASMHASISGTIDFKEKSDEDAIARIQSLVSKYREREEAAPSVPPLRDPTDAFKIFTDKPGTQYDVKDLIACIVDVCADRDTLAADFDEYKADFGQSIVCGYAKIGGHACGIVANQKKVTQSQMGSGQGGGKRVNMPGVIYDDSADKSARFIMDCNQRKIPIVFLHDTTGFMVGRDSEQNGIIRSGAKMVNAMSNCVVPKIVVITGGSYGAGNYAMCGRAFDQFLALAWPSAKCAVMGANQATGVLTTIEEASRKRKGETIDKDTHDAIYGAIHAGYTEQADIRHGAARGWVDRMIAPEDTRKELIAALEAANQNWDYSREFKTGVLQV
ncbi:MAG TPA: acyl-CoA carboxylase subunit beta [Phycisphaerales bacterium]|nr:acyl-CoA carboxylase subunit beta [Phycisphaerales bacterium]